MSDMTVYSGMNGSGGGDKLRILGMASGLDVDATVKKMMIGEQKKIDKVSQEKQISEWKQEMYQEIIADVKNLQNTYFDSTKREKFLMSRDAFSSFSTNISGDSTAISVSAGVGAQKGAYSISFTGAEGEGQLASEAIKTGNTLVQTKTFASDNWKAKKISFSINGGEKQTISLSDPIPNGTSAKEVVAEINKQIGENDSLKSKVQAVEKGGKVQFESLSNSSVKIIDDADTTVTTDLDELKGKVINPNMDTKMEDLGQSSEQTLSLKYNNKDVDVKIEKDDTIGNVINKIGDATGKKVVASYSELTKKFTLKTSESGSTQDIQVTSGIETLGLDIDADKKTGKNTVVYITPPGSTQAVKVTKSSRAFEIDGIKYNLNKKEDSSFTVTQDEEKVYDKIKGFTDKYNEIIGKINTRLTEKRERTYKPLTSEQKSKMKESEITAWNKKAKQGILKNDRKLENLLRDLRSAFYTPVNGSTLKMGKYGANSMGLDTENGYSERGKIKIADPEKLKKAILENSDQLANLFCNSSSSSDETTNYNETGVLRRMADTLKKNVGIPGTIINSAILTKYANKQDDHSLRGTTGSNTLPDQIYRKETQMKEMLKQFKVKREGYYRKFSKLEVAMNQLNAQQSWLMQQLS